VDEPKLPDALRRFDLSGRVAIVTGASSGPGPELARALASVGAPEILVNVAGNRFSAEPAEDEPLKAIRQTLDLNLIAPFRLAQEIFPHMRAASKLGLSGLTAELAVQWARHGIRVNTVAPGFFRSEITDSLYTEERSLTWLRRNTPLPRHGAPEDFTGAVLWLASDASQYVTGQTILVDGGWTAR
jgi:NAD(P)-dependent dehydrogenase (short-subunit alcohol dehydrogenase family)